MKIVIGYEKLSKVRVGLYPSIHLFFQLLKGEGWSGYAEESKVNNYSSCVYEMSHSLKISFGDMPKNKLQTPICSLSLPS